MPVLITFLREFFRSADTHGSRSTVLASLQTPLALFLGSTVWAATKGARNWVVIALGCGTAVFGVAFLIAFHHFARTNPDSLRSERFTLRKLEIDKGLIGDSEVGLTGEESNRRRVLLEAPSKKEV